MSTKEENRFVVQIDKDLCIGCGLCSADCLSRAIVIKNGLAEVTRPCFLCGHCVAICPQGAVIMDGEGYDMSDVQEIDREKSFIEPERMISAIMSRRSIRNFKKKPVTKETMEKVLKAGRYSPTASNMQNVSYLAFIENAEELRAVAMEELRRLEHDEEAFSEVFPTSLKKLRMDFSDDDFLFKGAPAILITVSPSMINASIASANMELMAVSEGLGAVYIGIFVRLAEKNKRIRDFLGLLDNEQICSCLSLGYPAVTYKRTPPRKMPLITWR